MVISVPEYVLRNKQGREVAWVSGSGSGTTHHLSVVTGCCLLLGLMGSLQGIWKLTLFFDAWEPLGPEDWIDWGMLER